MICVLVVASGAAWEAKALAAIAADPSLVLLKRCVDVSDLMAAATAEQADLAVVGLDTPGLDASAVEHLRRHRVAAVGISSAQIAGQDQHRMRASRIGIAEVVSEADLSGLAAALTSLADRDADEGTGTSVAAQEPQPMPLQVAVEGAGRIVCVWGPQGAPGRTTVATGLAAVLAAGGVPTCLVDADPYGGAVAPALGVLDEVSGMLSAARLAGAGVLAERLGTVQRALGSHLTVVTGLPRADRWVEVRAGAVQSLSEALREHGHVVVDTGFSLEDDPGSEFGSRPGRNSMTRGALEVADEVLVVGSADPVGLARLARALVELREVRADAKVRVVVNRMRTSLGWSERDIAGMVEGFARVHGIAFLPEDRSGVDRALVAGRLLTEAGDSAILRGLQRLGASMTPGLEPAPRRRRADRAHRR